MSAWKRVVVMALAVAIYTEQDVRNAECAVGCRRTGYDSGYFARQDKKALCVCANIQPYDRTTAKHLSSPKKRVPMPTPEPAQTHIHVWSPTE